MKYNPSFFLLRWSRHKKQEDDVNTEKLRNTKKKEKITKGYYLVSKPSFDTNWCESCDHVVMKPTIKIEICS
jgi:hypothetical protein